MWSTNFTYSLCAARKTSHRRYACVSIVAAVALRDIRTSLTIALRDVWEPAYVAHEHYVRVHTSHLRRKLEDDSAQTKYLLTETAVGYRLVT